MPHTRSPQLLRDVVQQFDLTTSERYRPGDGKTWCNIWLWDVTRALYCEVPHWVDAGLGATTPGARGSSETTANLLTLVWMPRRGLRAGWCRAGAEEAQRTADAGRPAVALWANPKGPGHVALLVPRADWEEGVQIAQAGAECFEHGAFARGFGGRQVDFWVHD